MKRGTRTLIACVGGLAVGPLALSAAAQPAAAAGDGSLARVKGKAGCLAARDGSKALRALRAGCRRARALDGLGRAVVSPGGGTAYVTAGGSDAVAVLRRADRTGALSQLHGRAGCVSLHARHGCGRARALRDPYAIVVTPDSRSVYVGSWSGQTIVSFARDRRTGALRQLAGAAGCVSGRPSGDCGRGRGLGYVSSLAVSPGGRFLYAGSSAGLAVFRRNARTGHIAQLRGADGCVTAEAVVGCARGHGFAGVADVALDRGGDNLYAAAGSIAVFNLAGGALRQLAGAAGCIGSLGGGGCTPAGPLLGPSALALSPGGGQLYATADGSAAVGILTRDRATGALSQRPGPLGCIRESGDLGCASARHLSHPGQMELSRDGRNAYVIGTGTLTVLRRDRTNGALSELPGKRGCLASLSGPGAHYTDCTDSGRLNPSDLTLSRDGHNVYITDNGTDVIAVYRRAR
jgi:DNA-binding beta-propeller fold protein YncE